MSRASNLIGTFETVDYSTAKDGRRAWTAVSLWCLRAVAQLKDGTPIICANRKSRATDKFCKSCSAACAGAT